MSVKIICNVDIEYSKYGYNELLQNIFVDFICI